MLLEGLRDLDPAEHTRAEYVRLLAIRAAEERRADQPRAVRRTLEALLRALDGDADEEAQERRADALFGLAQAAVEVDAREEARERLAAAMRATLQPERLRDRIAADRRLAALAP